MSILEDFIPEQKELLVSLPYRVGLFVSQSDRSGGAEAQAIELQALASIIHGFSQDVFGSEFLQYVMGEVLARQSGWQSWAEEMDHVPRQCRQAREILATRLDEKEIKAYTTRLMEIAEAVALAFCEYGENLSLVERVKIRLAYWNNCLKMNLAGRPHGSIGYFMSISREERLVLRQLSQSLGVSSVY
ncbi:MAG: hypothetical protein IT559_02985 [Alphaproteobacteria bacterium]|nr:hypothetical protein [Alphaproteobacteria bacterium]